MAYVKHNFQVGGVIYASDFNEMDNQIAKNEKAHELVTVTLTSDSWTNGAQTVTVTGVLADETKQVISPFPAAVSKNEYTLCGVTAVSQAANSLTFHCVRVPTSNLTVYIVIEEVIS